MKFTMLASGSKGNACIVETQNLKILIDCGTTKRYLKTSFETLNLNFEDIDAVLITHHHTDHTSQLKHFADSVIYTPKPDENTGITVNPYEQFTIGDVEILPIKTSHDDEHSVGYVINDKQARLVYITDTGYIKDTDIQYIKDADYYVMESNHDPELLMQTSRPYSIKRRILSDTGHLSNEEAGIVLSKAITGKTKQVFLAHLSQEANTETLALSTVASIVKNQEIEFYVAKQFEIITGGK